MRAVGVRNALKQDAFGRLLGGDQYTELQIVCMRRSISPEQVDAFSQLQSVSATQSSCAFPANG